MNVTGDETTRKLLQALDFGSTIKPLIRPVEKYNESLEVKLSLTLNQIGSLVGNICIEFTNFFEILLIYAHFSISTEL